jgi:hypothetical protein
MADKKEPEQEIGEHNLPSRQQLGQPTIPRYLGATSKSLLNHEFAAS